MVDRIEDTLNELALAMQGHRDVLAGHAAGEPSGATSSPVAGDPRAALIGRLLAGIETRAGLRVDEAIEGKLRSVLQSVGLAELEAWVNGLVPLDRDHSEWLTLIESLTTNETYLFRDWPQLELLSDVGLPALIADARKAPRPGLRVWSAGCASGEEAYTLAVLALVALAGAGVARESEAEIALTPPWSLDVLGTDISRLVLVQARNGLYGTGWLSSFRAAPQPLLRFFPLDEANPGRPNRLVRDDVRRHIRFSHFNLMGATPPATGLDLVACRNVLVYFAPPARKVAQEMIEAAVRPGGFLLLGPTDPAPDTARFEAIWGARAVIYRKRG
jgi:chemotaxis protein methyltransferase CheR